MDRGRRGRATQLDSARTGRARRAAPGRCHPEVRSRHAGPEGRERVVVGYPARSGRSGRASSGRGGRWADGQPAGQAGRGGGGVTPWWAHLFWGAIVYLSALQLGRGVATAGEWIAKAMMRAWELRMALDRETRLVKGGK